MANPDRNPTAPVSPPPELDALLRAAPAHDFFVALRLLQARLALPGIGTALTPGREQVRLAQDPSLGFAPAAISRAAWNGEKQRVELKLCFTGLLGPNGPMPLHLTEYVLDRLNHSKDGTLAAFLDIFHHRIYSLFFRAWALNQPTVALEEAGGQRHVHYLRCLVGLGTGGTAGRDSVPDPARIFYGGWLGGLSRSPAGLGAILSDYLSVPAEVRSFQGMWLELPRDSRCQLGHSRTTGVLGATCFAGERIWVVHLKFRIRFGPLGWRQYEGLLPGGNAFRQVAEWVRSYLGDELFWEVQLVLRREDVPECRLGGGVRLGWSTWLGQPAAAREVDDLVAQAA
jgi:type VI secretion system protein ImpH